MTTRSSRFFVVLLHLVGVSTHLPSSFHQTGIVGVNTFLSDDGSPTVVPDEVVRSTDDEQQRQIDNTQAFIARDAAKGAAALDRLQQAAIRNENAFEALVEAVKYCSLGQITNALFEVGGQYRRNM